MSKQTTSKSISLRFLLASPAHFIALGAGSGLVPKAPGTAGTLLAWLLFALGVQLLPLDFCYADSAYCWLALVIASLISWWSCVPTTRALGISDPGAIVCDEIVAFWLVLAVIGPQPWWLQLLAFILFRIFDAVKFGPVRWADQYFKGFGYRGAWGILFDDFIAAAWTILCLVPWLYFN